MYTTGYYNSHHWEPYFETHGCISRHGTVLKLPVNTVHHWFLGILEPRILFTTQLHRGAIWHHAWQLANCKAQYQILTHMPQKVSCKPWTELDQLLEALAWGTKNRHRRQCEACTLQLLELGLRGSSWSWPQVRSEIAIPSGFDLIRCLEPEQVYNILWEQDKLWLQWTSYLRHTLCYNYNNTLTRTFNWFNTSHKVHD